ncbi:MAG: TniQ family protein [Dissulfurispiraceae bacterium]|jgi:hypothetical protein
MNGKMTLLRTLKPYKDESFPGFLLRLAEKNGYDRLSWILQMAGIEKPIYSLPGNLPLDMRKALSELSRVVGVGKEELLSLLYVQQREGVTLEKNASYSQVIPWHMVRFSRTKVCPECLKEENYCRKIWDLAAVTACPIHKCFLYDECPNCLSPIKWNRFRVSVCDCNYDFRSAPSLKVKDEYLSLTRHIYFLCGMPLQGVEDEQNENPLYSLELNNLFVAIFFIAGQLRGVNETTGKFSASSRRNIYLLHSLAEAFKVFENWPNNFHSFLLGQRDRYNNDKRLTGLNADFGTFHYYLYKTFADAKFQFIRNAYEKYLSEQWDGGYLTSKCKFLTRRGISHKKYITKVKAQEILQVKEKELDWLLQTGELIGIVKKMKSRRMYLIDLNSVKKRISARSEIMLLKEVAKYLAIGKKTLRELAREKILCIYKRTPFDPDRWFFKRSEVESFLQNLEELVREDENHSLKRITFSSCLRRLSAGKVGLVDLIKAVLAGDIRPCEKGQGNGLRCFLFYDKDITDLIKAQREKNRGNRYSVTEASEMLGLKEEVGYFLTKKGIIPVEKITTGQKTTVFVTKESISTFEETYTTLSLLAKDHYTSPKRLALVLMDKGISPISGPMIDGGRQYIFRRTDLQRYAA